MGNALFKYKRPALDTPYEFTELVVLGLRRMSKFLRVPVWARAPGLLPRLPLLSVVLRFSIVTISDNLWNQMKSCIVSADSKGLEMNLAKGIAFKY